MIMYDALHSAFIAAGDLDELPYELRWRNLPHEDSYVEDLNFENFELLEIDIERHRIKICAGGDWKAPHAFWCYYRNDAFEPDFTTLEVHTNYTKGMDIEQFKKVMDFE